MSWLAIWGILECIGTPINSLPRVREVGPKAGYSILVVDLNMKVITAHLLYEATD